MIQYYILIFLILLIKKYNIYIYIYNIMENSRLNIIEDNKYSIYNISINPEYKIFNKYFIKIIKFN